MTNVYHVLASGPLSQNWSDAGLITANDDWSGVPSIIGYRGDDITSAIGGDPQTLTGDGTVTVDVNANQTNPSTFATGGVTEFAIADPTIALAGSGTADAPHIILHLDATGRENVTVAFNARDIDGSTDNAIQQIAVQFRIGDAGAWTNIPAGYIADATTVSAATQVTPVNVTLPAAADNQAQIQVRIITTNAAGNDEYVGIDDIVVDSTAAGGGTPAAIVSINDVSVVEGDAGTSTATFTVTRSDNSGAFSVDFATANGTATAGADFVAASGTVAFTAGGALTETISVTINGDTTGEPNEAFTVVLSNLVNTTGTASISDASGTGTITNDDFTITRIHDIQGNASNQTSNVVGGFDNVDGSPLRGQTVTVQAIVVGDFQNGDADGKRNLSGFYLQETSANSDADASTSEGIFVFEGNGNFLTDVNEGDLVTVTGVVQEDFGLTRIAATSVTVTEAAAVADVSTLAVEIALPGAAISRAQDGDFQPDLEAYEGMLVTIPQTLTITEQFNLDRFNEIRLYAGDTPGDRPAQFTHENAPDVAGNTAHLQDVGSRSITYDDGLNTQNNSIGTNLDGFGPIYDTATAPRMGDTITDLTGVLDYQWAGASASGSTWRVRAIDDGDNTVTDSTNPRTASPDDVGGRLTVGSLNVLNFFTTLDDSRSNNSNPDVVGPNNLEPRGANDFNFDGAGLEPGDVGYVADTREFDRQVEKLVNVLVELDADVLGLIELENNFAVGAPGNALEELVDRLNVAVGAGTYAWVYPGQDTVGSDAIAVGYLYKSGKVQIAPDTSVEILSDADLPGLGITATGVFDGSNTSRNVIAVSWQEVATGEVFTTAANHFKSKGGTGTGADADAGDGAGNWNNQRLLAATALAAWLETDPTGTTDDDYIILGDLNSYFFEDPIAYLEAEGYTNLQAELLADPYSFVFDGQIGALDYILANAALVDEVTGITEWHINADEADALDYNLDFSKDPAIFDGDALVRVSDHDPILVGLTLNDLTSAVSVGDAQVSEGDSGTTTITFTVSRDKNAGAFTVDFVTGNLTATTADGDFVAQSGTLTFAAGGALTQTISVTVNGDLSIEADETFNVTLSNIVDMTGTASFDDATAVGTITNDDAAAPGVIVTQSGGTTTVTEGGAGDTITVALTSIPTADVTVAVTPDAGLDLGNGPGQPFTLTFTPTNATTAQTIAVTAVDDQADEGTHTGSVSFAVSSTDPTYNGITVPLISPTIVDNDQDGVPPVPTIYNGSATPTGAITLEAISTIDIAGAEISAYDSASKRFFVTSTTGLQIVDATDPSAPALVTTLAIADLFADGGELTSVASKDGIIAVAISNLVKTSAGRVVFIEADTGTVLRSITVGPLPDMVTFTPDGNKVLVANEGEPLTDDENGTIDPAGRISVIDITDGVATATVTNVTFTAFNAQQAALEAAGVRIDEGKLLSQGLEPEYIAVSPDGLQAFITLQENNAFAILDLTTNTITSIVPLGTKDHGLADNAGDFSDRDVPGSSNSGIINIQPAPGVVGLYQPDAIASFTANGQTFYVTANEGDSYEGFGDDAREDEVRVGSATLDPTLVSSIVNASATDVYVDEASIKNSDNLGRLTVSTFGDTDGDGDLDQLQSYGGRSFSIWDAAGNIVFDSGSLIERATAALTPELFNANNGVAEDFDERSDDKAAEPEGITVGTIGDRTYAFVTLERAGGGVMAFDITDPANVTFANYARTEGDIAPEGVLFVAGEDSPNGNALVAVANEVSGTLTIYEAAEQTFQLQLLHLADGEAGLLASDTAPLLAALVDAFEDDYANTLILAGGDNYLPGPFLAAGTDASVAATHSRGNNPGAADIEIHNRIGVEASTVGNHEFDLGTNAFSDAVNDAAFPYLSANLDFSGDSGISGRFTETVGVGGLENVTSLARRIVPSAVVEKGGETIGLIGVTTQILEAISSTGNVEVEGFVGDGLETNDVALLAAQLQPVIDDLRSQGVNKIILMAHLQQIQFEIALAPLLEGVDIILAAGSNTRLGDADDVAVAFPGHAADFADTYPIVTAGLDGKPTVIVNTDNEYTYLGRLVVEFDTNGEIILESLDELVAVNGAYASTVANVAEAWGDTDGDLSDTAFAEGTKGEQVADITEAVDAVIQSRDGDIAGFTNVYLEGERNLVRNQETNLGNITADANLNSLTVALGAAAETTFVASLKNGGGIRAPIGAIDVATGAKEPPLANPDAGKPENAVSLLDIENSLRFNNGLMAFDTTAAGLKAILEHGVAVLGGQGRFPQIGGVRFFFDDALPAGSRIESIALIDENDQLVAVVVENGVVSPTAPATITLVTLNFLANGGDGYPIKANGENFRFLLNDGTLSAPVDEAENFTAAAVVPANILGEQQALVEYLEDRFATPETAFNEADTEQTGDTRIQNADFRADTVLDSVITGTDVGETIEGTAFADEINALGGNDTVLGNAGDDSIDGGAGNDLIIGGAGADQIEGGSGFDTASYVGSDAAVNVSLGTGNGSGGHAQGDRVLRVESLIGSSFNDTLSGNSGVNVLQGGDGNDLLRGSNGGDTLDGGAGIDTAIYSDSAAGVTINLSTGVNSGSHAQGDVLISIENVTGSRFADAITGDDANNTISGGDGNDTIFGGAGNDSINAGLGADIVDGGEGTDVISYSTSTSGVTINLLTGEFSGGDAAGDTLTSIESVTGSAFADVLTGNASDNLLRGGNGLDQLFGNAGADTLDGGDGNDTLVGGAGADRHLGGTGIDTALYATSEEGVFVNLAAGTASGGDATGDTFRSVENLTGSSFGDTLAGNASGNALDGGDGDDVLVGGFGVDTLTGGLGADTFSFGVAAEGGDTIIDFVSGEDILSFEADGFGGGLVAGMDLGADGRFVADASGVATNAVGQFLYDTDNGQLFWDVDGTGAADSVLVATLQGAPTITSDDLTIV